MKNIIFKYARYSKKVFIWSIFLLVILHVILNFIFSYPEYFRDFFEKTLNNHFNLQVNIGQIHGNWFLVNPEIKFQDIVIKRENGQINKFGKAVLMIDLFRSLYSRSLILKKIKVKNGSLTLPINEEVFAFQRRVTKNSLIWQDLLNINDIELQAIHLELLNPDNNLKNHMTIEKMTSWTTKHRVFMQSSILFNNSMATIYGMVKHSNNRPQVSVYFEAKSLELASWIAMWIPQKYSSLVENNFAVNTKWWFTWQPSQWSMIGESSTTDIHGVRQKISLQNMQNNFSFTGSSMHEWTGQFKLAKIKINQCEYPDLDINLQQTQVHKKSKMTVGLSPINLGTWSPLIIKSHFLPDNYQNILHKLQPQGIISNIFISFFTDKSLATANITGKFNGLSVKEWQGSPAITNFAGEFEMANNHGIITLNSSNSSFFLSHIFANPIKMADVQGKILWKFQNDIYTFYTANTKVALADQSINTVMMLDIPIKGKIDPYLSLKINMDNVFAKNVTQFIPSKILSTPLNNFLQNSLVAGQVTNSIFLWHGSLIKNNFGNHSWSLKLNIDKAKFHYSDKWPDIEDMQACVYANQYGMRVRNAKGRLIDSVFTANEISILDFKNPIVKVVAQSIINGKTMQALFRDTPLNNMLNKAPQDWHINGQFDTYFKLSLPLEKNDTQVSVNAMINNGGFAIPNKNVSLNKINGKIEYTTKNGLQAKQLTADFLGHSAKLAITNELLYEKQKMTTIKLDGHAKFQDFYPYIPRFLHKFGQGSSDYQLNIGIPEKGEYFVELISNLQGITIDLPDEFGKMPHVIAPSQVLLIPSKEGLNINVKYHDKISGMFSIKNQEIIAGEIFLNPAIVQIPSIVEKGIAISGHLTQLDVASWYSWYQQYMNDQATVKEIADLKIQNLSIDNFFYKDINLHKFALSGYMNKYDNAWYFSSDRLKGVIFKNNQEPFEIKIDYLHLPKKWQTVIFNTIKHEAVFKNNFVKFPEFCLSLDNLFFDKKKFGELSFCFNKDSKICKIGGLNAELGNLKIIGDLEWNKLNSHFQGELKTNNLNQVFTNFNYHNSYFSAKKTTLHLDISWPDYPEDFNINKTTGKVDVKLHHGLLNTGKESNLKFFGLFNIDAIARRLKLDFSDLFDSGIAFDLISGKINLNSGLLHTATPLLIDGPSSDFSLKGTLDLQNNKIDMGILVMIPVAKNLPVLSLLLGQPIIAGAIYFLDKLLDHSLMSISSVHYNIHGTIENPVITKDKIRAKPQKK